MTKNGLLKTIRARAVLIITVLCLLFTSVAMFSACKDDGKEDEAIKYTSSTKIDSYDEAYEEGGLIKNGGFEYLSVSSYSSLSKTSFPIYSSLKGWTLAQDGSATSSNALLSGQGGIIDQKYWSDTITRIKASSSFKKLLDNGKNTDITDAKIEEIGFKKEDVFADDRSRVLMLNAYTEDKVATAVKATSSNTVLVEAGKIYKITFSVRTANLLVNEGEGANFRLVNSISGNEQEVVGIYGIDTKGEWKDYTFFVKADDEFDANFTIVLGLGRGGNTKDDVSTCIQGTAFFDNVNVEEVDNTDGVQEKTTITLDYAGKESKMIEASTDNVFLYDMSFDFRSAFDSASNTTNKAITFNGATLSDTLIAKEDYKLLNEEYAFVSFDIDTHALGELDIHGVSLYYKDGDDLTGTLITTFKYSEDIQHAYILFKNNFIEELKDGADDEKFAQRFELYLKIGSTTDGDTSYLPTSDVTIEIKNLTVAIGKNYQYATNLLGEKKNPEEKVSNYKFTSLFTALTSGNAYILSVGFTYNDTSKDSYSFNVSKNVAENDIQTAPVEVNGYKGVSPDSIYVNATGENYKVNEKVQAKKAGLINSAYNYITIEKSHKTTNKYIQPLYIKNDNESYGFIGTNQTLSAASFAKISVLVRVEESAKAFVYIIDASTMKPLQIREGQSYAITLTAEDMYKDGDNEGWALVSFYIATGNKSKSFRVELWNGSRDEETHSTGIVYFDEISISTSAADFTSARWEDMMNTGTLGLLINEVSQNFETELYSRPLNEKEQSYYKEYPDETKPNRLNYLFAKSEYTVYGDLRQLEYDKNLNPYDSKTDTEDEGESCANANPSNFWLSFSSIVLVAVIILALVALIIKNLRIKRKKNASDAKTHYVVTSRYSAKKDKKKAVKESNEEVQEVEPEEIKFEPEEPIQTEEIPESQEQETEEPIEENNEEVKEETLDSYVYGEVQDFGENLETNEIKSESEENASVENATEEKSEGENNDGENN